MSRGSIRGCGLARAALLGSALMLLAAAPAEAAKFATPSGSATNDCTAADAAHACTVQHAVDVAPVGDEVIVMPGDYDIQQTIVIPKKLTVNGPAGQPVPHLIGAAGLSETLRIDPAGGNVLRRMAIESQGASSRALVVRSASGAAGATLEGLYLTATGGSSQAARFEVFGLESAYVFRDSVARTTGTASAAVFVTRVSANEPLNASFDVRNVTADARGVDSVGLSTGSAPQLSGCANIQVTAKNLIALGTRADINAIPYGGCPTVVDTYYSNWRTQQTTAGGTVNSHEGDQFALPSLVSPSGGDYRQLPGSVTIDAGVSSHFDSKLGTSDFEGQPRLFGSTTDIGADEYVPAPPASAPGGKDTAAPGLQLSMSKSAFRAAPSGPSVRAAARYGTVVRYTLSEPATVRFGVQRAAAGRRVGGRCVRPKRSNRRARRCTRYVTVRGGFSHKGKAGSNRLRFTGRLRGRKLKPGHYRLTARAHDAAGNASRQKARKFRILR